MKKRELSEKMQEYSRNPARCWALHRTGTSIWRARKSSFLFLFGSFSPSSLRLSKHLPDFSLQNSISFLLEEQGSFSPFNVLSFLFYQPLGILVIQLLIPRKEKMGSPLAGIGGCHWPLGRGYPISWGWVKETEPSLYAGMKGWLQGLGGSQSHWREWRMAS